MPSFSFPTKIKKKQYSPTPENHNPCHHFSPSLWLHLCCVSLRPTSRCNSWGIVSVYWTYQEVFLPSDTFLSWSALSVRPQQPQTRGRETRFDYGRRWERLSFCRAGRYQLPSCVIRRPNFCEKTQNEHCKAAEPMRPWTFEPLAAVSWKNHLHGPNTTCFAWQPKHICAVLRESYHCDEVVVINKRQKADALIATRTASRGEVPRIDSKTTRLHIDFHFEETSKDVSTVLGQD